MFNDIKGIVLYVMQSSDNYKCYISWVSEKIKIKMSSHYPYLLLPFAISNNYVIDQFNALSDTCIYAF